MARTLIIRENIQPVEVQGMGRYSGGKKTQAFTVNAIEVETRDGSNFDFRCIGSKNGRVVNDWFMSRDPLLNIHKNVLKRRVRAAWRTAAFTD